MTLFHEVCPALLLLDSTIFNTISVMRNDNESTVVELEFQSRHRSILGRRMRMAEYYFMEARHLPYLLLLQDGHGRHDVFTMADDGSERRSTVRR
jgi:hypothetical protein